MTKTKLVTTIALAFGLVIAAPAVAVVVTPAVAEAAPPKPGSKKTETEQTTETPAQKKARLKAEAAAKKAKAEAAAKRKAARDKAARDKAARDKAARDKAAKEGNESKVAAAPPATGTTVEQQMNQWFEDKVKAEREAQTKATEEILEAQKTGWSVVDMTRRVRAARNSAFLPHLSDERQGELKDLVGKLEAISTILIANSGKLPPPATLAEIDAVGASLKSLEDEMLEAKLQNGKPITHGDMSPGWRLAFQIAGWVLLLGFIGVNWWLQRRKDKRQDGRDLEHDARLVFLKEETGITKDWPEP